MRRYHKERDMDKVSLALFWMSYVIFPFIFYPMLVKEQAPIIAGLFFWAMSPIIVPGYALVRFMEWAIQFTF